MEKKLSYEEAFAQLETVVGELEAPDINMDVAKERLKRAAELIDFCKKELAGYKEDFSAILDKEDKDESEEQR